ncbi:M20 family metallopeptidase [Brevibacillus invocatus]|uniref:M20 family peptidase n=1 Tax=Brevibacillus invocatus TaxID=173959 RepID=A0A3M8CKS5_9BACL|nr:M20 family metallopeptidase [Brevibacillus invocatus]MCM3078334.1 M20 family metallopeptidase [Brevibacillus invocatus]MCM3428511.1 M20 family metallopeptidase [Brevibacillus invocatus]RNB76151.1 M20 family peptidase [Brevibacillus invocatus]
MKDYLQSKQEEMLHLLEKLVNIDSGTYVKSGIDEVGRVLQKEYEALGYVVKVDQQPERGNNLTFRHKDASDPQILAIAHMDTVFVEGTVSERPFTRDEKRAYGPGVHDMKGSQVALLYALKALIQENAEAYKNVVILLNTDEEIGSPESRPLIEAVAKETKYALIVEPSQSGETVVSQRKGGGKYFLKVSGIAAHAGGEPEKGRSAIEELAHKIVKLHALTDLEAGVTLNVGIVRGGTSVNTISPHAYGALDVRVETPEQAEEIDRKIREICATPDVEGTSIELTGKMRRPPLILSDASRELLAVVQEAGRELGVEITDIKSGGGSDGNLTAAVGVATIDGLGPVGAHAHSAEEYLEIDSLVERTLLIAKVIQKLS